MTMTEAKARKKGYEIVKGAFTGTNDDRADRWYIQKINGPVDRRGPGVATKKEALEELAFNDEAY